jgi:hypothetical protein
MSMTTPTGGANYNQGAGAGLITSVTPAPSGQARVPFQAGLAKLPETKQTSESALVQTYRNMSPALRRALSQQLKDAGYGNPVTDKFNIKVREAFLNANRDLSDEVKSRFQTDPAYFENNKYDLSTFLKEMTNTGGGSGDKGPNVIRYRQELRPETVQAIANQVYADLNIGRAPNAEEIARYTRNIEKELSKKKNMAQTTYKDMGGGVQERIDRPGLDVRAFLFQELAGNNEAKQRSIFSFYDAFKKVLGV